MPTGVNWISALGIGVSGINSTIKSNAVATDPAGDTFITGSFRGTASFDPNSPTSTITTNNTQDTFVAKYSPTGTLSWVKTFAGTTTTINNLTVTAVSQGSAIVVDPSGNLFVAGGFSGTVNLTGSQGLTAITSPTSTTEVYLAKLGPDGNLTWVDTVVGTLDDTDQADALALDGSGGVVMAGSFADSATFGSTALTAGGASDAFVSRVNSSGQFVWSIASQGQAGSNAQIDGLAVDGSGNVVLAGFFSGTIDVDPGSSRSLVTSQGSDDALIWKLSASGSYLWSRVYGSTDYDTATAIAVDPQGNIYATGAFSNSVSFGSTTLTAGPNFDAFVLKLSPTGTLGWADGLVGPGGWSKGLGIAIDPAGNVELGGTFQGQVDFNPGSPVNNLTSVGYTDVFAEGLDQAGSFLYALQDGTTNFNAILGVSVNASGLVAETGTYSGSIGFGSTTLPAIGISSAFVAKLVSPGLTVPSPSPPILDPTSDTGLSQTDGITSATSPLFDINTAISGDTVELLRNGVVVASRVGSGSIRDPGPLDQGAYSYSALQLSPSNVSSVASGSTSITVMTAPPASPPAPVLLASDDSGVTGDGITNVRQPRLVVFAAANTTVQVVNSSGTVLASNFATTSGPDTIQLSQPLVDGSYPLQARLVDLAGNVSAASSAFALTILATPPPAPSVPTLLAADVSGPAGGTFTNVRQPRFTGTARSGTTVEILSTSGLVLATSTAINGTYSAKFSTPLSDGTYTVGAISIDAAGNQSPPSLTSTFTIDGTPPVAPTGLGLYSLDDSGTKGDGITDVRQPRLTGTSEAGSTVQIVDGSGKVYGSTVAASNGAFTAMVSTPLANGAYALKAVATDAAGNVGPAGSVFSLTILLATPATPSAPSLLSQDDSGKVGDGITNVRQPRITGIATAGLTVQLLTASNQLLGTTSASVSGTVTLTPSSPLADGTYLLHFVAVDVAGNLSAASPTFSLEILATSPSQLNPPTLLAADLAVGSKGSVTTFNRPTVVGVATSGDQVSWVTPSGTVLASTTASTVNGAYQLQPTSALLNGLNYVEVRQADAAGNVGLASLPLNLTIRVDLDDDFGVASTAIGVFGKTDYTFNVQNPMTGALFSKAFGIAGDVPINGNFFGDGHNDIAVYRPSISTFYVFDPITNAFEVVTLGQPGDVPIPADYDGDGQTDFAVFRPSTQTFFIKMSSTNAIYSKTFAISGDIPVPADYYGNGHADIAVYRPSTSTFYVTDPITNAYEVGALGLPNSTPIPADYEGLGHADFAVFEPGVNNFVIKLSATNTTYVKTFAIAGDVPVPGDYFGNGRVDLAVFRPSTATFYEYDISSSAYRVSQWGAAGSVKPVLAPINYWFNFGVGFGGNAFRASVSVTNTSMLIPDLVALDPTTVQDSPTSISAANPLKKTSTLDQAIEALSLETWRP